MLSVTSGDFLDYVIRMVMRVVFFFLFFSLFSIVGGMTVVVGTALDAPTHSSSSRGGLAWEIIRRGNCIGDCYFSCDC